MMQVGEKVSKKFVQKQLKSKKKTIFF